MFSESSSNESGGSKSSWEAPEEWGVPRKQQEVDTLKQANVEKVEGVSLTSELDNKTAIPEQEANDTDYIEYLRRGRVEGHGNDFAIEDDEDAAGHDQAPTPTIPQSRDTKTKRGHVATDFLPSGVLPSGTAGRDQLGESRGTRGLVSKLKNKLSSGSDQGYDASEESETSSIRPETGKSSLLDRLTGKLEDVLSSSSASKSSSESMRQTNGTSPTHDRPQQQRVEGQVHQSIEARFPSQIEPPAFNYREQLLARLEAEGNSRPFVGADRTSDTSSMSSNTNSNSNSSTRVNSNANTNSDSSHYTSQSSSYDDSPDREEALVSSTDDDASAIPPPLKIRSRRPSAIRMPGTPQRPRAGSKTVSFSHEQTYYEPPTPIPGPLSSNPITPSAVREMSAHAPQASVAHERSAPDPIMSDMPVLNPEASGKYNSGVSSSTAARDEFTV